MNIILQRIIVKEAMSPYFGGKGICDFPLGKIGRGWDL